ncbi:globoside alpha-1,3-N-acetylgalactosaminyltransferase 1-like isoform X1 [Hypomesus transpacificus]|uniref:globoside alpha-1,3-N-acetylgalactosaminyltransferase 1-like isoform X1 n=1 Tax=Hypomesus transpacificus TaxID=137520 RepID=UPI001F084153|nr:globoside alpha-1,3-N-acetylgalactosaminyltransferase 1-like isoform X1 [Hypomesus transpacificus]XP_046894705.1 globoside alpha-1,3-N-acetylgalactosaminyltransferase 1-like isoform X1 [Hypomesus transpacificus]
MRGQLPNKWFYNLWLSVVLILLVMYACFFSEHLSRMFEKEADTKAACSPNTNSSVDDKARLLYEQPKIIPHRTDVVFASPWLAPIVWQSSFNSILLDGIYKPMNITIATTVFALGKYVRFLKDFLGTAEIHYMVGYKVDFYIFTDSPGDVPNVTLAEGRRVKVMKVPSSNRWQDISARRMEMIQLLIENTIRGQADYIFCLDVDSKFYAHFGVEALGRLVATIHPNYWFLGRDQYTYERRPESRAYIPWGEGDFYYGGALFGGLLEDVRSMAETCRRNFEADTANGIEAAWQEESHLNRYFLYNKPSKLLSPEYLWQDVTAWNKEIWLVRFSGVDKNYAEIRPN